MTCTVMCLVVTYDNILGSDFWILSLRSYVIWLLQTITHSYHYHAISITSFSYVENPCPCIHGMLLSSPCCILVSHLRSHGYGWKYYWSGTGCRYFFYSIFHNQVSLLLPKRGEKREKEWAKERERGRKRRQPELHSNKQKNGSLRNEWWWENNRLMEKNKIGEYMK